MNLFKLLGRKRRIDSFGLELIQMLNRSTIYFPPITKNRVAEVAEIGFLRDLTLANCFKSLK